jgi:DNA mismatch repair ATPase MutL
MEYQISEKISLLPATDIELVRATVCIYDFPLAVEEVILNAVDALSEMVIVRIDLSRFFFEVEDNGIGIGFQDLHLIGSRYCKFQPGFSNHVNLTGSSKTEDGNKKGFRGEALCSLASVGILEIETRRRSTWETFSKHFKVCSGFRIPVNI